ncbi:MAG: DUF1049 domain-containing protein [Trueperaceae bacterium]|nr:MAG: DUF1049 domain-containing protein [Trueperaceae bacterium]
MRLKGTLVTIVLFLGLLFAVINWQAVFTPLPVNLLFFNADLPLGVVLLFALAVVSLLFFAISLFDRASQLRQITQLERQLESLRAKLDKRRLEEIETLERAVGQRSDALEQQLAEGVNGLSNTLQKELKALEERAETRLERLHERVVLVRDELAADIAQTEDLLRRELKGETPDAG